MVPSMLKPPLEAGVMPDPITLFTSVIVCERAVKLVATSNNTAITNARMFIVYFPFDYDSSKESSLSNTIFW